MSRRLRGYFRSTSLLAPPAPFLTAIAQVDSASRVVEFLVDTGAAATVLHPVDANALGLTWNNVCEKPVNFTGVGGIVPYWPVKATLWFADNAMWASQIKYGPGEALKYTVALESKMPSLLGMDFLSLGRLVMDHRSETLTFEY